MRRAKDLTGETFGRLTVVGVSEKKWKSNPSVTLWDRICECGNLNLGVAAYQLVHNKTVSCGCKQRENGHIVGRSAKGSSKTKNRKPRSNTGFKGITKTKSGRYHVSLRANGKQMHVGQYNSLILARKTLIKYEKIYQFSDITRGDYDSVCAYSLCKNPFNKKTIAHLYCTPLCRSKAYKERRLEEATSKKCPQCGHDREEPLARISGKSLKYCRKCQDYFQKFYISEKEQFIQTVLIIQIFIYRFNNIQKTYD